MADKKGGRSTINIKNLTMWKQTVDTKDTITYDSAAYAFDKQLQTARYTPSMQTSPQYGDGQKVEDYVAKDGGTLEIGIRGYDTGDDEFLYGNKANTAGVSISNVSDVVPYVCVAYQTERPDGTVNLYKFPKVKFMPQGEDSRQREGTSVSYATTTISGTYSPTINSGDDMYKYIGADPTTDAEMISKWFELADYVGEVTP